MNIVAIIPARAGSKGLKNKNIYPILSKPLIQWTIDQVKKSKLINKVLVSTNDAKIEKLLSPDKSIELIRRPDAISGDNASSEAAIIHAINFFEKKYKYMPDVIVFLQATSPLRKNDDIDNALNYFINNNMDSLFSATKIDDLTLWKNEKNNWKSINFDYKDRKPRQLMNDNFIENGSIYIFKTEIILNENNRLGGKIGVFEMDFWQTWEIDSIEEVDLVEFYLKKKELVYE